MKWFNSINSDLMSIYKDPPPGVCVVADEENVTKVEFSSINLCSIF